MCVPTLSPANLHAIVVNALFLVIFVPKELSFLKSIGSNVSATEFHSRLLHLYTTVND